MCVSVIVSRSHSVQHSRQEKIKNTVERKFSLLGLLVIEMKTLLQNILNSMTEYSRISCDAVRVRQRASI